MGVDIIRLLKMGHYRGRNWLRIVSTADFWIAFILFLFPWYFPYLANFVMAVYQLKTTPEVKDVIYYTGRLVSIPIILQSILRLLREFWLSRYQIVGRDYMREAIRQSVTFLMDQYGWQGSCRVTVLVPTESGAKGNPRLRIYDRISAGLGPSDESKSKVFFLRAKAFPERLGQMRGLVLITSHSLMPYK
jgi:hypothetical protein